MKMNKLLIFFVCLAINAGCSKQTPQNLLDDAEKSLESDDFRTAEIKLKNLVKDNPDSLEGRKLLANVYLQSGQYANARKELEFILSKEKNNNKVIELLYRVLYFQEDYEGIIEKSETLPDASNALITQIYVYRSIAFSALENPIKAKRALEQAEIFADAADYTSFGKAYLLSEQGAYANAQILLEDLLSTNANFYEARLLQGQLYAKEGDYENAVKSFEQFNKDQPSNNKGKLLLADSYTKIAQFEQANPLINQILSSFPNHHYTNILKGIVLFNEDKFESTIRHMDIALISEPDDVIAKLYAGVAAYNLGKNEQAFEYLLPVSKSVAATHPVNKILSDIKINLGYTSDALKDMGNYSFIDDKDKQLLFKLSADLVNKGMTDEAKGLLKKIKVNNLNDAGSLAKIGILKLSLDDASGISDLEKSLSIDDETITRFALIEGYINTDQLSLAKGQVDDWLLKSPDNLQALNTAATVYLKLGDLKKVEEIHAKALSLDSLNLYSINFYTKKAIEKKNFDRAIELQKKLAKSTKATGTTLFNYFLLEKEQGEIESALSLYRKKIKESPENFEYITSYAQALLSEGKSQELIDTFELVKSRRHAPDKFWQLWAEAFLINGDELQALGVYQDWRNTTPTNIKPWLFPVMLFDKTGKFDKALRETEKALIRFPTSTQFQLLRAHYLILNKQIKESQRAVELLSEESKNTPEYKSIIGHIAYAKGDFPSAIKALTDYYNTSYSSRTASIIYSANVNNNTPGQGVKFLEEHLEIRPDDATIRLTLASIFSKFDVTKSIMHYRVLANSEPNNFIILNNLSWQLIKQERFKEALEYGERAFAIAPESATVLDTYGYALLKSGNVEQAAVILNKAFEIAPDNEQILKHLNEANTAKSAG
ncbi:PEP-CTERM system TPR-repeat protein PrsT [Alteromonas portus]|uniref:PEP-CTERM system TPR-repeat protein PrsT n=2 Tax=Alteromonas portus TaxID=2565549 RepID=A0A4U0ZBG5_9ALTE|nr:PEP-CTERM system TPR-repeat protein PrsT [Alteromonas portus]